MPFSAFKSFKLGKGLSIEERVGAAHYKARARIKGVVYPYNTETADFDRAKREALSWFKRMTATSTSLTHTRTVKEAAGGFLADLPKSQTKDFYDKVWNVIGDFFNPFDVDAITTPVCKDFIRWRRALAVRKKRSLTSNTLHKDFVALRRVLRYAVEEGWLDRMPLIPKLEKIKANPRPWLEQDEWDRLVAVAEQRIADETNPRAKRQKQELLDFCHMMVCTAARVDEVRAIRVRDCVIKERNKSTLVFSPLPTGGYDGGQYDRPYLEIRFKGKTDIRNAVTRAGAVDVFNRVVQRRALKPEDKLWEEHHVDGFRELLIAADLRERQGQQRNFKSLRCTALMLWIKSNPRVNLQLLSDNSGTSVNVLSKFYLKPLRSEMHPEELL